MDIKEVSQDDALTVIEQINLVQTAESGSTSLHFSRCGVDIVNALVATVDGITVGWCVEWSNAECHAMVVPSHRRRGIGNALIVGMIKLKSEGSGFCPWDNRSIKFYETFKNVDIHKNYKYYMKSA